MTQQILIDDENILQIGLRKKINYELISMNFIHCNYLPMDHPERIKEMVKMQAAFS